MSEPARYPQLPFKIGLLSILIGPLAGAISITLLQWTMFKADILTLGTGFKTPPDVIELLHLGATIALSAYVFGIVPAAITGFLIASEAGRTGRLNWRRGLLLGAVTPLVCLLMVRAVQHEFHPQPVSLSGDLLIPALAAAAIGFAAAALTGISIKLILPELRYPSGA